MGFRLDSLGLKLNLALLLFFLVVGVATAAIVYFGFSGTRENASERSREALEELGRQNLQEIANSQADFGALQLEWAAEIGHRAARYMQEFRASGGNVPVDVSRLARTQQGLWYDPNGRRGSDLVVLPRDTLDPAVLDDIAYSAPLESLFPALVSGFPHELAGESFHPSAIVFVGVSGMGRYYPPRGTVYQTTPADMNLAEVFDGLTLEDNPERKTRWSPPYQDLAGQGLVITAQTPVYEGDRFRGLVEVDLRIGNLVETVNQVEPTANGFAFYVDVEGKILRTDAYDLLANELESQDNEVLGALVERMKVGERGVERVQMGGEEFFVAYAPILEVGGGFAVAAPVPELTAEAAAITAGIDEQADRTMTIVLTSMAGLFAIALVGATYLNRRMLLRPIEALVAGTRAVAQGDFETQIPIHGADELGVLGHSFNQMTAEILQRADSLRQEVREREAAQEELRALFAAMTDRVIVFDRDGRVIRLPETSAVPVGVASEELPGMTLHDIVPDEQAERIVASIRQALTTRATVTEEFPYVVDDGTYWFSSAFSPISEDEVVMVARDITERVNAGQELERQVGERTRELQTLLKVSRNLSSTLELRPLLDMIIEQLQGIADFNRCSIFEADGETMAILDSRATFTEMPLDMRFSAPDLGPIWERMSRGESVVIDDVHGSSPDAEAYRRAAGPRMETYAFQATHSALGVPLTSQDRIIGMLVLTHIEPGYYNERHASLVSAIATQIAVAIENARLYEQVQARTRELETLLTVSRNVASTLDLGPLLQVIIEQVREIADYSRCSVFLHEGNSIVLLDSQSTSSSDAVALRIPLAEIEPIWDGICSGEPVIVDDVRGDSSLAAAYRRGSGELLETVFHDIHAWMGVPLESKDHLIGMLTLSHTQPGFYTRHHASLVTAIATQVAVAIDNARLYEQAQQLAAVEERQRLARELHDSVSQALYGIALGARTARTLLDRDPSLAAEPVDYVLSLAEAGLAEMRALIFELRPESLEIEGLVAALDKQIAATAARYGIEVTSDLTEEPAMSLAHKEIFYRIGQEALHNVVKHSRASKATVRLARDNGSVLLEVGDNGVGFDASRSFPGHMGLVSMSERASSIGALLEVESNPGKGTTVKLRLLDR